MSLSPVYSLERWWTREWQKLRPEQGIQRYYRLILRQDLWGEWELIREWGRIGRRPSRMVRQPVANADAADGIAQEVAKVRQRRGYESRMIDSFRERPADQ